MADRRLQVFHTVGRMLSFTKAAEVLQMTQPAVTFQVRQLEEQYNVRLFDRSHNRIDLTEAGKRAFQYAERIFDLYCEMDNSIREVTGDVSGLLRIGASTVAAQYVLPNLLAKFKDKYKDIHIQLKIGSTTNVLALIENSFVDVGVIETNVVPKKVNNARLCEQELILVLPRNHELANRTTAEINDIMHLPWIMREEGSSTRELIYEYFSKNGVNINSLNVVMELGCPEAIKSAVEGGCGVAILPREAVEKELRLGSLVAVSLEKELSRTIEFVYKEQKFPLRAVDELIKFVAKNNNYYSYEQGADTIVMQS